MNHVRISSSLLTPECPGAERAVEKIFCVKYDVSIILRKKFFFFEKLVVKKIKKLLHICNYGCSWVIILVIDVKISCLYFCILK